MAPPKIQKKAYFLDNEDFYGMSDQQLLSMSDGLFEFYKNLSEMYYMRIRHKKMRLLLEYAKMSVITSDHLRIFVELCSTHEPIYSDFGKKVIEMISEMRELALFKRW